MPVFLAGKKIREIRKTKKINQHELADRLKYLNQSQVSKIEKGYRKVTDFDLINIANALDVPVNDLLNQ